MPAPYQPPGGEEYRPGYPVPRDALARTDGLARRVDGAEGDGYAEVESGEMGLSVRGHSAPPLVTAVITGSDPSGYPGRYSWVECWLSSDQVATERPDGLLGFYDPGVGDGPPALEVNGNDAVPLDTVVRLWPSDDGEAYYFAYPFPVPDGGSVDIDNAVINLGGDTTINVGTADGDTLTIDGGTVIFEAPLEVCNWWLLCYATLTVDADGDLSLGTEAKAVYRLEGATADRTLYGISTAVPDLGTLVLLNTSDDHSYTLAHESALSGAGTRRFLCPGGEDYEVPPQGGVILWRDPGPDGDPKRYRVVSALPGGAGGAGGGGGVTSGQSVLAANYAATNAYADTGVSVTLPTSGTWTVQAEVAGTLQVAGAAGGELLVRLYNVTAGAAVADTIKAVVSASVTGVAIRGTAVTAARITVAGATTVRLDATYAVTGAVTTCTVLGTGSTTGVTVMRYWSC